MEYNIIYKITKIINKFYWFNNINKIRILIINMLKQIYIIITKTFKQIIMQSFNIFNIN